MGLAPFHSIPIHVVGLLPALSSLPLPAPHYYATLKSACAGLTLAELSQAHNHNADDAFTSTPRRAFMKRALRIISSK